MYKVIYKFADLKDCNHIYNVGDVYPREESKPTSERIAELSGKNNKIGRPLIEEIKEAKEVEQVEEKPVEEKKKKSVSHKAD